MEPDLPPATSVLESIQQASSCAHLGYPYLERVVSVVAAAPLCRTQASSNVWRSVLKCDIAHSASADERFRLALVEERGGELRFAPWSVGGDVRYQLICDGVGQVTCHGAWGADLMQVKRVTPGQTLVLCGAAIAGTEEDTGPTQALALLLVKDKPECPGEAVDALYLKLPAKELTNSTATLVSALDRSGVRITHPVRGRCCSHSGCGELSAFLTAQMQTGASRCPGCLRPIGGVNDLVKDEWLEKKLRGLPPGFNGIRRPPSLPPTGESEDGPLPSELQVVVIPSNAPNLPDPPTENVAEEQATDAPEPLDGKAPLVRPRDIKVLRTFCRHHNHVYVFCPSMLETDGVKNIPIIRWWRTWLDRFCEVLKEENVRQLAYRPGPTLYWPLRGPIWSAWCHLCAATQEVARRIDDHKGHVIKSLTHCMMIVSPLPDARLPHRAFARKLQNWKEKGGEDCPLPTRNPVPLLTAPPPPAAAPPAAAPPVAAVGPTQAPLPQGRAPLPRGGLKRRREAVEEEGRGEVQDVEARPPRQRVRFEQEGDVVMSDTADRPRPATPPTPR
eukprot:Hpha_TRINITY_DN26062_c0_g1::TRINITY_DN26062_c0_g1_i1::g.115214::m.115214